MKAKFLILPVVAAMSLGAAACGDDDKTSSAATPAASSEQKAGSPTVTISSPGDGETIGSKFTAKVDLDGFAIDEAAVGKDAVDGKGHLHFSLDGGKFDSAKYSGANGKLAEQLGTDGKYSPSVANEITYENIPAGEHTLEVDLANNDHSDTGSTAKVTFTVEGDDQAKVGPNGERVTIEDVQTTADGFTAMVALDGVVIDAKNVGKKARDGKGHLHFELDGGKYDSAKYSGANGKLAEQLGTDGKYSPAVAPTITYSNLPKGKHVLKVYVANNDHSENGAVVKRTITVG
jgi:hypothetical protein